MADDDDEVQIFSAAPPEDKPKRGGRPPGSKNRVNRSADKSAKYEFVVDTASALTGLVCLQLQLDSELAPNRSEYEAILVPLLRILDRRVSILSRLGPDAEDAALALVGIIAYVTRVVATLTARRAIAQSLAGNGPAQFRVTTPNNAPIHGQAPRNQDHLTTFYESIKQSATETANGNAAMGS